jgi:hypothetical protein
MSRSSNYLALISVMLLALFSLLPGALAQETTAEPSPSPTETAAPTFIPTETPTPTPSPTVEPTQTPVITPETTVEPVTPTPEGTQPAEITPEATEIVEVTPETTPEATDEPGTGVPDPMAQPEIQLPPGIVPVIVQLRLEPQVEIGPDRIDGSIPEGLTPQDAITAAQINVAQAAVSQGLSGLNAQIRHTYEVLPYMALTVDQAALAQLQALPQVVAVYPDIPTFSTLETSTQIVGAAESAGRPGTWASGYDGTGYVIAVLDEGIQVDHPMFPAGKIVDQACFSGAGVGDWHNCWLGNPSDRNSASTSITVGNAASIQQCLRNIDLANNPAGNNAPDGSYPVADLCTHGVHVAGIAAGDGPTYDGVARDADLMAINVFSTLPDCNATLSGNQPCLTAWTSDIVAGLEHVYLKRNTFNIAAANLSLGGGRYYSACDAQSPSMYDVVARLRAANIPTIVSTGNSAFNDSISFPACLSNVIAVGSTVNVANGPLPAGYVDQIAGSSNLGSAFLNQILLAPGQSITSALHGECSTIASNYTPSNMYCTWSGTSMAAPHVAGAWAVIREARPEASLTAIFNALRQTGTLRADAGSGVNYPRINIDSAVNSLVNLISPSATTVYTTRPTFSWSHLTGATYYEIIVTTNGVQSFGQWVQVNVPGGASCTTTTCTYRPQTTVTPVSAINSANMQWFARAFFGATNTTGDYIGPETFIISSPTQTAPAPGAGSQSDGTFTYQWNTIPGATHYQLYVQLGTGMFIDRWVLASSQCDDDNCAYTPPEIHYNGSYSWFVRGYGPEGYSLWRGPLAFTQAASTPAIPSLLSPNNGQNIADNLVNLQWSHAPGNSYYQVYVVNSVGTAVLNATYLVGSADIPTCNSNCTLSAAIPGAGGFTWYVRAYGPGGWSVGGSLSGWGGPRSFSIAALPAATGLGTDQPTAQPIDTNADPRGDFEYRWSHTDRASHYRLYVARSSDNLVMIDATYTAAADGDPLTCSGAICAVRPGIVLNNGTYAMNVQTIGLAGNNPWALGQSIAVNLTAPSINGVEISGMEVFNNETITADNPFFRWEDIPNANYYEVVVVRTSGTPATVYQVWHRRLNTAGNEISCGLVMGSDTICQLTPTALYLTNGTYQWYVRAYGPGGLSTGGLGGYAGPANFTINGQVLTSVTPSLVTPANSATVTNTNNPTFTWEAIDTASWYYLEVSRNDGAILFQQWRRGCFGLPNCVWTPTLNLANGPYRWRVQAYGAGGFSLISPYRTFTIQLPPPPAPTLISPADDAVHYVNNQPTFSWNAVPNATFYLLEIRQWNESGTLLHNVWYSPATHCAGNVCSASVTLVGNQVVWRVASYGTGTIWPAINYSGYRDLIVLE